MEKNLNEIIDEEIKQIFKELFDPNTGNLYQPPGLDPTHVRLFEKDIENNGTKN